MHTDILSKLKPYTGCNKQLILTCPQEPEPDFYEPEGEDKAVSNLADTIKLITPGDRRSLLGQ